MAVLAKTEDVFLDQLHGLTPDAVFLAQSDVVLELGSTGAVVKEVQAMLALMGYYSGAVDGLYEQSTSEAVRQFQTDAGLLADGVVGPLTWQRLLPTPALLNGLQEPNTPTSNPEPTTSEDDTADETGAPQDTTVAEVTTDSLPTLQIEDTGPEVRRLQQRLAELTLYGGPIDGVFGVQTEAAVAQFQRQAGLGVDGVVGPATWGALLK